MRSLLARARSGDGPDFLRAAAALALGWLVLVLPIFFGRSYWYRDQSLYVYPLRIALRERLLRGELPLWNPALGLGRPFFGFILPAVLDPLNAMLLLPVPFGQDLYNASHLLLAAVGAYAWLRALACERPAAALGAMVFAYGSVLASMATSLGPYLWGNAWIPWSLLLLVRASRDEGRAAFARRAIALGLCLAETLFSGDPMAVWFAALAGLAQAMALDGAPRRRRALAALACGGVVSLGLTAVQLLPALHLAHELRPDGVGAANAGYFSLHPRRLLEVITASPWGPPFSMPWHLQHLRDAVESQPFVTGLYPGVVALSLVAFALAGRPLRRAFPFAVLGVGALLLALGRHTPAWALWYQVVLPARFFRYPEKYLVLFGLALAPLAALGLPRALARGRGALFGALGASLALGLGAAAAALLAREMPELPASLLRSAALFLVAAGLLHVAAGRGWSPSSVAWAVVALGAFDLLSGSAEVQSWTDAAMYQEPTPLMRELLRERPRDGLLRVLRPIELRTFTAQHEPREYRETLAPDVGAWHGVAHVASYETHADPQLLPLTRAFQHDPIKLWRLLGVRFTIQSDATAQALPPRLVVRALPRYGVTVLRVPAPAARVFLAARTAAVPDLAEALKRVQGSTFDPARHAVLEGGTTGENAGACALTEDRVEALTVRCEAERDGWLIVTDAFATGWRATVDGRPRPVVRANGILRAIPVHAGSSTTRLTYDPPGLRVGRWISAASLLACAAALVALRRGARP